MGFPFDPSATLIPGNLSSYLSASRLPPNIWTLPKLGSGIVLPTVSNSEFKRFNSGAFTGLRIILTDSSVDSSSGPGWTVDKSQNEIDWATFLRTNLVFCSSLICGSSSFSPNYSSVFANQQQYCLSGSGTPPPPAPQPGYPVCGVYDSCSFGFSFFRNPDNSIGLAFSGLIDLGPNFGTCFNSTGESYGVTGEFGLLWIYSKPPIASPETMYGFDSTIPTGCTGNYTSPDGQIINDGTISFNSIAESSIGTFLGIPIYAKGYYEDDYYSSSADGGATESTGTDTGIFTASLAEL